jgi:hypothetical protein
METIRNDRQLQQIEMLLKNILTPNHERDVSSSGYFYRIIGCDEQEDLLTLVSEFDEKLSSLDNYILFDMSIPLTNDPSMIEKIKNTLEPVSLKDFFNGALLNALESRGYFSLSPAPSSHEGKNQTLREVFGIVLNLYMLNEQPKNISIAINFVTKILLWLSVFYQPGTNDVLLNPKILYWGSPKTHEIYFLTLMFLLGYDVIIFNTSNLDRFEQVDKQNQFSIPIVFSKQIPIASFPRKKPNLEYRTNRNSSHPPTKPIAENPISLKTLSSNPIIEVKLKRTDNPFEDVLIPVHKRSGYISGQFPVLPTYFVRYIGAAISTDDWEAEYYNKIYNLDRTLQLSGHYLRFLEGIPAPTPVESSMIPEHFNRCSFESQEDIVEHILETNILPFTKDPLFDNTIKQAFIETLNYFRQKQPNLTPSMLLNFSLKLVVWLNRYMPKLFERRETAFKILYYGSIKLHEIYLLNIFHKIGGDVLYIHSDLEGDLPFQVFDYDGTLSQVIKNAHSLPLVPFPIGERLIRKSTVAYNASKEIEEIIYSEDIGLYKPWQFESYLTQPITLKTTYEELKILWQEPAKIRPEFKVQNKKVYVPNLFAKINGVNEELSTYWQDLKTFAMAPNTCLIESAPFSKMNYTRQELYEADYLFDEQGYVDEQKVVKSQHYKFRYLRTPLQQFLISKLNELLFSDMLLLRIDERMKLKMLMTILTIDDALLKLIETFDFPQEIPKIIIYDRNKQSFSEIDAILLAYLNLIGLDILIFTPTKYNTLEQLIRPNFFDVFQLPVVKYELDLPQLQSIKPSVSQKQSFFSRFFNTSQKV